MEINTMAPVVATKSISIPAPVSSVWKTLTEIDRWREWVPGVASSALEDPFAVNSRFVWKSGGMTIRSRIQDIALNERLAWSGTAIGTKAHHVWRLSSKDDVTIVTTHESMEGWLIRLLKPWMRKTLENSLEQWLAALKERAELENP